MKWQEIATAPLDGDMLAAWPGLKLDEDGEATEEQTGKYFIGVASRTQGQWSEPDALNAMGEWFGDDMEWSPTPTHWMHLPDPPTEVTR